MKKKLLVDIGRAAAFYFYAFWGIANLIQLDVKRKELALSMVKVFDPSSVVDFCSLPSDEWQHAAMNREIKRRRKVEMKIQLVFPNCSQLKENDDDDENWRKKVSSCSFFLSLAMQKSRGNRTAREVESIATTEWNQIFNFVPLPMGEREYFKRKFAKMFIFCSPERYKLNSISTWEPLDIVHSVLTSRPRSPLIVE